MTAQRRPVVSQDGILASAQRHAPALVAIRRELHADPELGFQEHRTAARVAGELRALGVDPATGVGGTGVVADIRGARDGPTVLLRADMDGLPIEERSDVPYASRNGVMHACGHDGHVAMLLGAARLLVERQDALQGTVRLLFQPAEERPPGGALATIEDGVLEGISAAVGLHVWNPLPVGTVGISTGAVMAAHDRLRVRLAGRGGHGAMPESTRDPIVTMASLIMSLQTVVSRAVSPLDHAVVTVGTVGAGSAFNVIADEARLEGSIRTLRAEVRDVVHERIREIAAGVALAGGAIAEVALEPFVPAVVNDPDVTASVARATAAAGPSLTIRNDFRTMAGEDMAFILERVPGCFVFVGSGFTDGREVFPHHHPSFDIDERSLPIGVAVLVASVFELLGGGS